MFVWAYINSLNLFVLYTKVRKIFRIPKHYSAHLTIFLPFPTTILPYPTTRFSRTRQQFSRPCFIFWFFSDVMYRFVTSQLTEQGARLFGFEDGPRFLGWLLGSWGGSVIPALLGRRGQPGVLDVIESLVSRIPRTSFSSYRLLCFWIAMPRTRFLELILFFKPTVHSHTARYPDPGAIEGGNSGDDRDSSCPHYPPPVFRVFFWCVAL